VGLSIYTSTVNSRRNYYAHQTTVPLEYQVLPLASL
jgi:hypothetical protein